LQKQRFLFNVLTFLFFFHKNAVFVTFAILVTNVFYIYGVRTWEELGSYLNLKRGSKKSRGNCDAR